MIFRPFFIVCIALLFGTCLASGITFAERRVEGNASLRSRDSKQVRIEQSHDHQIATATVHWQGVSLREAIARLRPLFKEVILVDRRVDPEMRVNLDIAATSAEQVLNAIGSDRGYHAVHVGKLVYFGPAEAADRLHDLIAQHARDLAHTPPSLRLSLARKQPIRWERLSEPRQIIADLAHKNGWQITGEEQIAFDLWDANDLPELSLSEALTVLLIGFDLSFEINSQSHALAIIPLASSPAAVIPKKSPDTIASKQKNSAKSRTDTGTKQVYTLHVQEKPVGAVLRELAGRLSWSLHIDEDAIRQTGKSLDQRVSFSVTNADREKLLTSLLTPAGLEFRIEGNDIYVFPERYKSN